MTREVSDAFLASVVASASDAILTKDLRGNITSWNQGAERLFGYTAAEAIGRPVLLIFPEDRYNEEPQILAKIAWGERVEHYETVRRRKDGTLINVSLAVSPIRDSTGKIVGAAKIARDITAEKREQLLHRAILRNIGDAVMAIDLQGSVTFVNAAAEVLTGWTERESNGRPIASLVRIVGEGTAVPAANPALEVLRTGASAALAGHAVLISCDGTQHPISGGAAPIQAESGGLVGAVLTFRGATE